jgi:hypothetical protein
MVIPLVKNESELSRFCKVAKAGDLVIYNKKVLLVEY